MDASPPSIVEVRGVRREEISALDADARAIPRRSAVGVVFQFCNLLASLTASQHVAIAGFGRLHESGHTIILVTEDPTIAAAAERAVSTRDGRTVSVHGPEVERAQVSG